MNKVIKFRGWDKEQKVMTSWEQLMDIRYNERWFIDNTDKNYINCLFMDSDYILMQFTGLYDKDGKEIYEGDIVRVTNNEHQIQKMSIIGIITMNYGAWGIEVREVEEWSHYNVNPPTRDHVLYFLSIYSGKDISVIGNIYENKDLIREDESVVDGD